MADEPGQIPTQQEMEAGAEVVAAGEKAAEAEPDPGKKRAAASRGIRREAKSKGWELSEEQAEMLAGMVVGKLADELSEIPQKVADVIGERGGFDNLPEPLSAPAAPTGAGTAAAQPPAAGAPDERPGGGRTGGLGGFAGWFRGNR